MARNLKSIWGMEEEEVRAKFMKKVREGRVLGPFTTSHFPFLIHHLSFPWGESVNNTIPGELCSVWYISFDQAMAMARQCGKDADLANAILNKHSASFPFIPTM